MPRARAARAMRSVRGKRDKRRLKYASGRPESPERPLREAQCSARGQRELLANCGEQRLVDLAVIDRDVMLVAEPDDVLALQVGLLRQLFGRQVIRHACVSLSFVTASANKKPTGARARWVSRP